MVQIPLTCHYYFDRYCGRRYVCAQIPSMRGLIDLGSESSIPHTPFTSVNDLRQHWPTAKDANGSQAID